MGRGHLTFLPAYAAATAGSITGFMVLYFVGRQWGRRLFQNRKRRIFSRAHLIQVESWFDRYGYMVIGVNRFLSGFRAVVSLGAGIVKMDAKIVFGLCLLSCLVWNGILMGVGVWVGENWAVIVRHYQWIVFILILLFVIFLWVRAMLRKHKWD